MFNAQVNRLFFSLNTNGSKRFKQNTGRLPGVIRRLLLTRFAINDHGISFHRVTAVADSA